MIRLKIRFLLSVLSTICFPAYLLAGEVDVIQATLKPLGNNQYTVAVTLRHDDTGWEHYANAWELVDSSGRVIAERVLHHPHVNEQPFTRSLRVAIPDTIQQVTVRAKDSVHGYGGKTLVVKVPSR